MNKMIVYHTSQHFARMSSRFSVDFGLSRKKDRAIGGVIGTVGLFLHPDICFGFDAQSVFIYKCC
jgi:hypothetical protein